MDRKSPYVLVGAAMILFIASIAGFVVWKLRAGDRTAYAYYDILFSGEVQGLTNDSPVFYRGLRVGRVTNIGLTSRTEVQRGTERQRTVEKIEVTVAVDWNIDIRERSYAVFEKPFIAGSPFIQIVGRLDVDQVKPKKKLGEKPYPEIREGASFLQATTTSAQELLAKANTTVDKLNELLSADNIAMVTETLTSISTVAGAIAKQEPAIQSTLAELPVTIAELRKTFDKVNGLTESLGQIALELGPQDDATRQALAGKVPGEIRKTFDKINALTESLGQIVLELGPQDDATKKALAGKAPGEIRKVVAEARAAFASIDSAAGQLGKLVAENKGPIRQFSQSGLTELSLTIRELRQLTANLNVIATRLERDPAGFVFSGKQGYTPK